MTVETQQKIYERKVSAMLKEIKDLKKKNKDRQTNTI